MELPNIAAYAYQDVHVWSALLTCLRPWEKTKVLCPVCSHWHRGTPHARLVHCSAWSPVFLREWVRTWGPWEDMVQRWLDQALPEDLDHISKLRISSILYRGNGYASSGTAWRGISIM